MNIETIHPDFPKSWRELLNEMQREWDRLHEEIAQLRTERDHLSKALVALLHDDVKLSQQQILEGIGREPPLRDLLQELRGQLKGD